MYSLVKLTLVLSLIGFLAQSATANPAPFGLQYQKTQEENYGSSIINGPLYIVSAHNEKEVTYPNLYYL